MAECCLLLGFILERSFGHYSPLNLQINQAGTAVRHRIGSSEHSTVAADFAVDPAAVVTANSAG